jgi:hypothetical protein
MAPLKRALVVEYVQANRTLGERQHPLCKAAVHDGTLTVIHLASGEIAGYAAGVWRRWWYSPLRDEEPRSKSDSPDLPKSLREPRQTDFADRKNAE